MAYWLQSAFTGGELSPSLLSRLDMAKYGKGCRTLKNAYVQAHGPAVRRPGFEYLGTLPGEAVLLEFTFSQSQAYALIMGENWMRVAVHGGLVLDDAGYPYQISSPYTLAQAKELSYVQSADVLFLACWGVSPYRLIRRSHADWRFEQVSFAAPIDPPSSVTVSISAASDSTSPRDIAYTYAVTAVTADGKEGSAQVSSSINGPSRNNWDTDTTITISWDAVAGAESYRLYRSEQGGRYGYIVTLEALTFADKNNEAVLTEGFPQYRDPFLNGDYPGVVGLFEQRLVYAATPEKPQTIWMSKSGDYGNFAIYDPLADDSPIEITLASREVSPLVWIAGLEGMAVGTSSMEWSISSPGGNAFSATTAQGHERSYWGSSLKKILQAGENLIFVTSSGRQLRTLQFDAFSERYVGSDLTILSSHLFDDKHITSWCYQKNPNSIIWAVLSDGSMRGFTFHAEHEVTAWHRHETQGRFLSVCSVPYGYDYDLFAVVARGESFFLERMEEQRKSIAQEDCFFVDSGLQYAGSPAREFSGLEHLEGLTVSILGDGARFPDVVVHDGKATLPDAVSKASIGLPYECLVETMPVELMTQAGASCGLKKQINPINVAVERTLSVEICLTIGSDEDRFNRVKHWEYIRWRSDEPYGSPPKLFTGVKHVKMPNMAENISSICVKTVGPFPLSLQSIMAQIQVMS